MSEVCTGFLSSSQLPSLVWASWWQKLYAFQSHTKPGLTSSSLVGFSIFWTQGFPCIIAKKETIVSHFSLFCFFLIEKKTFFENFIHRYHIHIISIPCLPHALLSCLPQIHYFLLLKLLLLYMYTYTHMHTHICVYTRLSSFIAVCVYRCLGLTTWGHQGAYPWRKLVIPLLAAIYCLHVFIQGPCEIPLILVDISGFA